MTITELLRARGLIRAPEGEGGGGGGDAAAAGGDGGQGAGDAAAQAAAAAASAGDSGQGGDAAAQAAAAAAAGDGGQGGDVKWWDGQKFTAEQRQYLQAKGLTLDDPLDAMQKMVGIGQAADKRFGKPLDSVIDKPKEGQSHAEWLKENAQVFGLPENPDGYKITPSKDFPKDQWDKDFEAQARQKGLDLGLTQEQMQGITDLYAGKIAALSGDVESQFSKANDEMMAELQRDWGKQTEANMTLAKQGAAAVAEAAGVGPEAIADLAQVLTTKAGGDANAMRMFHAIGKMMSEDGAVNIGRTAAGLTTTPAEARAEAAQLRGADGAYYKAVQSNNRTEIDRLGQRLKMLDKIATGG